MSYKIGRAKNIEDSLELVDGEGNVIHSLSVNLDIDKIAVEFNKKYNTVIRAERLAKSLPAAEGSYMTEEEAAAANETIAAFGESVCALFELIFGEENTGVLLDFYEKKYFELSISVIPFITEIILPKIKKSTDEAHSRLAKNYKITQGAKVNKNSIFKLGR